VYVAPTAPEWETAWRITEKLLRELHREANAADARFLLTTLSTGIQVHPDAKVRERFAAALGADDLLYPDRRLEAFAEREGIPAVIMAPLLRAWAEGHDTCVHGFYQAVPCGGHWNEHANHLAAERIRDAICPELLLPREDGVPGTASRPGEAEVGS
jgi:hypothetical protein